MEDYEILDVEDIIELHDMLIRDFGGMSGIFLIQKQKSMLY